MKYSAPQRVEVRIAQTSCCFDIVRLIRDGKSTSEVAAIIKEYYGIGVFSESIQQFVDSEEYRKISNAVEKFDEVRLGDLKVQWTVESGGGLELPPMLLEHVKELEEVRQDVVELHALAKESRTDGYPEIKLEEQLRRTRVFAFDLRKEIHARTVGSLAAARAKELVQEVAVLAARTLGRYIPEDTQRMSMELFKAEILRILDVLETEYATSN